MTIYGLITVSQAQYLFCIQDDFRCSCEKKENPRSECIFTSGTNQLSRYHPDYYFLTENNHFRTLSRPQPVTGHPDLTNCISDVHQICSGKRLYNCRSHRLSPTAGSLKLRNRDIIPSTHFSYILYSIQS